MIPTLRTSLHLATAALLWTACSPSVNPALKTSVDTSLANVQPSSEVYPADASSPGYQSGQWLRYKVIDKEGKPAISEMKMLQTDGTSHTLEVMTESYYARTVQYLEVTYTIGTSLDQMQITRAITKQGNEAPTESSPMELSMTRSMLEAMAGNLFIHTVDLSGAERVQVAAGIFEGCGQAMTTLSVGPFSSQSQTWHHPAVPMHGMVRSQSVADPAAKQELLAFGLSGAQSEVLGVLR